MKITIVQGAFLPVPPLRGGAVEKMWMRMGQEFASAGHTVVHVSRSFPSLPKSEMIHGVRHLRTSGFATPRRLAILKILDLMYSSRVLTKIPKSSDVIVSNTFWLPILMRGDRARRVYVDVQRVPRGQMKFYSHVGRLRACSPAIKKAILGELRPECHALASYVPNPVPFDIPSAPDISEKEKKVLFVGRLHPEKGVHTLIEAWNTLRCEDWELCIVGPHASEEGGGGDAYHTRLRNLCRDTRVSLVGPVYDEGVLKEWFRRSAIFCYPAQGESGDAAPVAPREAMAFGCATVTSSLPCFSDFILPSQTGIVFDESSQDQAAHLAGCLEGLLRRPDERERLALAGFHAMAAFAPTTIAATFLEDFTQMLRSHGL